MKYNPFPSLWKFLKGTPKPAAPRLTGETVDAIQERLKEPSPQQKQLSDLPKQVWEDLAKQVEKAVHTEPIEKFEVGDTVITNRFESNQYGITHFDEYGMGRYVGEAGVITEIAEENGNLKVHDWFWPQPTVTLVDPLKSHSIKNHELSGSTNGGGGNVGSTSGTAVMPQHNDGYPQYPWRLVKSTKHKVMYFLKANYPNSYSGREIARATGLNTSQVGGALKHCGDHVKKVGTHVGPKGCVGFKWQGVLKERV
jgi:hypothetical protein